MSIHISIPNSINGRSTFIVNPQGLSKQRRKNITYPFATMKKPVGVLRVVIVMNSYMKHGRPCGDAGSRDCSRGDSIHRLDSHALRPENLK